MSTSFSDVYRQGNAVAYALAQRARHYFPISFWLDSYPTDISSSVLTNFLMLSVFLLKNLKKKKT